MRKTFFVTFVSCFSLLACTKTDVKPSSSSAVSSDATQSNVVPAAKPSHFDILTSHSWRYARYYTGYVDSTNPGTLAYKRGRASNSIDLTNVRGTFYPNSTYSETDNYGNVTNGTWRFLDYDQLIVQVTNSYGVYTSTIQAISKNQFSWVDNYGHTAGVEITAP